MSWEKIISLLNNTTMPGGEKKQVWLLNDLYMVASDVLIEILLYLVNL